MSTYVDLRIEMEVIMDSNKEGKQFVANFKEKDSVHSVFVANSKVLLKDKNGKPYMNVNLMDRSGGITAMIWDRVEEFDKQFESGDMVKIKGHVQKYQDKLQVIVHHIDKVQKETVDIKDFFLQSEESPEKLFSELIEIISSVKNEHIKRLLSDTIREKDVEHRLKTYPAAKTIHHAKIGGLLEHIVSICRIMDFMASHYNNLNRDLLIFGAIYHDIGKLWELSVDNGFQYTTSGRLIGHMAIAQELLDDRAREILGFPKKLKDVLKHIILSHHGKLEYGSPKRPKFLEALIVAMVDDLDSKVNSLMQFMKNDLKTESSWTGYSKNFERYLYLDVLRDLE